MFDHLEFVSVDEPRYSEIVDTLQDHSSEESDNGLLAEYCLQITPQMDRRRGNMLEMTQGRDVRMVDEPEFCG